MPLLFAITLLLSAALLFLIQPMVGRLLLPLIGGTPSVWNTCVFFFQSLLLLGYLFAHLLASRISPRGQVRIHLVVLSIPLMIVGLSVMVMPERSPVPILESLAPDGQRYPIPAVLMILTVAVGAPFFVVSTTAPLLQRWFAATGHPTGRDPYYLYAASNVGSMAALIAYPLLVEPSFPLATQEWIWALGYTLLVMLIVICSQFVRLPVPESIPASISTRPPTVRRRLRWMILAFVPSSLMLGVTTFLTTDVAPVPLLWVVPLALYLLSFVIAFSRIPAWPIYLLSVAAPPAILLLVFLLTSPSYELPLPITAGLHLSVFFLIALIAHGLLALDRPSTDHLTGFYLWVAIGGVLGGAFNGLLAPIVFSRSIEYVLVLAVSCYLLPGTDEQPITRREWKRNLLLSLAFFGGVALLLFQREALVRFAENAWGNPQVATFITGVIVSILPLLMCLFFFERSVRFGMCVSAVLLAHLMLGNSVDDASILRRERSYFGSLTVVARWEESDVGPVVARMDLLHGTTLHGSQFYPHQAVERSTATALAPLGLSTPLGFPALAELYGQDWRAPGRYPLTYYHPNGPFGQLAQRFGRDGDGIDIGVVGLGTGSISAYAPRGSRVTFYEIDPMVLELVDRPRYLSFLHHARKQGVEIDVVLGDARLELDRTDRKFDVLVVDAFSSDAIPLHLMTREAVALYVSRLKHGGILAIHLSNRHLNLRPVTAGIAHDLELVVRIRDEAKSDLPGQEASTWAVLTRREADLRHLRNDPHWYTPEVDARQQVWSDEYSNVIDALEWPWRSRLWGNDE